jgi:Putative 2OG-Fe(II) oxygenase
MRPDENPIGQRPDQREAFFAFGRVPKLRRGYWCIRLCGKEAGNEIMIPSAPGDPDMAINEKQQLSNSAAKLALLRLTVPRMPKTPALLFQLAEALTENHQDRESAEIFRQAYLLEPSTSLCNEHRYAAPGGDTAMHCRARSLIEHGVIFSPVIAALAISEALLGNEAEVGRLVDYNRFFKTQRVPAPEGFCESSFNALLAAEIKSDLRFYDEPARRAIRKGWRNDGIMRSQLPASRALCLTLRNCVDHYIACLPEETGHPFVASRPREYVLRGWAVVSDARSHHRSHIHPGAWMSGVYYVVRPPASLKDHTDCGWLRVGPPEWSRTLPGWGTRLVEPEPGNLVLMPGYFFHETAPMGFDEERICVAFDVVPVEIAANSTAEY